MESPKRKMQKKNDYQRHKLFRKIKRRRKAQAEAEQQIAEKQLRKKLKLPKFDRGEDDGNYLYKSDIHINKDASITDVSTGKRYDGARIPEVVVTARKIPTFKDIEKQIGRKIMQDEINKIVAVDPEIPIELPNVPKEKGVYSPSVTNEFINTVVGTAGDATNYLANKAGLSNLAPNEQLVETRDGDALFDLPGYGQAAKLSLYGLGRYGGKLGLKKLQKLAKQKLLERELTLSNVDKQLAKDIAYSKPGYNHELIISPSKKQKRLQLSQPTYQVYTGNKHKISEVIDGSGNVNLANLLKIQNEALSSVPGGRLARHILENPDWHKTDWNTFLHSRDAYQRALQAGYPNEALFPTLMHDAGKLWAGDGHGPYGASIVKQMFPDATDEQIMAIYQHMDKVPESAMGKLVKGADIAEDNPFRVFKDSNILKQNSNGNIVTNSKALSDKIKEGYFNYTKGQEIPLNFDGNYFRATKNMPQVISEGDAGFKNFPVGEYYSENVDDYYKNVMQPLFDKQGIDPEMRLPRGVITVPENDVSWTGYFDGYSGTPYIKARSANGNLMDAIRSGQLNSTYLHEAASHGTDFKIPSTLKEQYRFENFLPSGYKWNPSVKDSKDWQEYRATMNQVRHRLLDTEHLINGKYPSGKELQKAIDDRQMDLIMANFDVASGYGADYYNAYKDLLNKAKQTNSSKDWQNVIDLENHIRNSLKYLPTVVPFAIGAKSNDYNSGKDIHIKPSKRGTFTKAAKQHGMSVQGFANRVLRNPSKYSAAMRKKANFAHNASKWNR